MLQRAAAIVIAASVALTGQGLLGLAGAQASPPEVTPTLAPCPAPCGPTDPPSDQTKINQNDHLRYGGNATAGSTIVDGKLLIHRTDGSLYATRVAKIDSVPLPTGVMIRGTKAPMGLTDLSLDGGWVILEVTAENSEGRSTGRSVPVYIDLTLPRIEGTFLTQTNEVEVRFSEPVKSPKVGDLTLDWQIDDAYWRQDDGSTSAPPVDSVDGSESTRTLSLASGHLKDEDATPRVFYRPAEQYSGLGTDILKQYRDHAGNYVSGNTWNDPAARDLVPPSRVPVVESIAGQALGGVIIGRDATPEVVLSNLRTNGPAGIHKGRVYLETGISPGFQAQGADADMLIGTATAQAADPDAETGTATIDTTEALGSGGLPDGEHTFYAVAADRALCNPPSGSQECPNLSQHAAPATYLLDTIAPTPISAELRTETEIEVRFSESITPVEAGAWSVTQGTAGLPVAIEAVSGSGDTRTITLSAEATTLPVTVSWDPVPAGYEDVAGNLLGEFSLIAVNDVPLTIGIVSPAPGQRVVSATSVTLQGSVLDGLTPQNPETPATVTVDIFPDPNLDGIPDGTVQTLPADGGSFSAIFPLPADGSHWFTAIGRRVQPDKEVLSQPVSVEIIRDTVAPSVSFAAPSTGTVYSGFQDQVENERNTILVRWTSNDSSPFSSQGAVLWFRPSAGAPWEPVSSSLVENGEYEFVLTEEAPLVDTTSAQFKIHVTDVAGNTRVEPSAVFEIDSTPPYFSAMTIDTQNVRVWFNEAVQPSTTRPEEWRLDGKLAELIPASGSELTFILRALPGNAFGANDTPKVIYKPIEVVEGRYRDEAMNRVQLKDAPGVFPELDDDLPLPRHTVAAADGIAPGPATLNAAPSLVDRGAVPLTGFGDGTAGNQVVARRVAPSEATYSSVVNPDGTFDVLVGLEKDSVNVFRVQIADPSENTSAVHQVVISEDSSAPLVTVKDRKKRINAKRKALVVQWASVEPHPGVAALYLELKKRNGRTQLLTISDQAADDGQEQASLPTDVRTKMRKGKIKAMRFQVFSFDALGHVGSDTGRWIEVRGKRRR